VGDLAVALDFFQSSSGEIDFVFISRNPSTGFTANPTLAVLSGTDAQTGLGRPQANYIKASTKSLKVIRAARLPSARSRKMCNRQWLSNCQTTSPCSALSA
jgi:hypothetical protein